MSDLDRWLARVMPATERERAAALWSFAYFFALLAGYYVLRPLRDQMGIAGGVKNLPWLFTATFVTLLVAQPLYGALVARLPRARFIPVVYHFFVANIVLFWALLTFGIEPTVVARVFFVWVSVFNLFAVAVFWSFMADLFTSEQGKRLFGFIGAGGTAGALLGPRRHCSWKWRCFASTASSAPLRSTPGRGPRRKISAAAHSRGSRK
jgi:ATP:ADP antiporter, AAA family